MFSVLPKTFGESMWNSIHALPHSPFDYYTVHTHTHTYEVFTVIWQQLYNQ